MKSLSAPLAAATAALLCSAAFIAPAEARTRHATAQVHGQRGSASAERTTVRARGERSRTTTVTGANGRTTTATDTRARDRQAGTATHEHDRTYADGATRSVDANAQRTGAGTYSASRTVTGRDGESHTQTGDFTRTATENGHSVTGTVQTENHGVIDYQRDTAHVDGTRTVNASSTFEDGTSRTRATSTSRDATTGVVSSNGSFTNRQGETTTSASVRTPTETGAIYSRDTSLADGTTREVDRTRTNTGPGTASIDRTVTDRDGDVHTQTGTVVVTPPHP